MNSSPIQILLAEDNSTDALRIGESLKEFKGAGFAITHVETLAACLAQLRDKTFDAILVDLGLPDSQGLTTLSRLRECPAAKVVIVLTGLEDDETGTKAVQMGAEDYLMKSQVGTALLGRAIRYAIERHLLKESEHREAESRHREVQSLAALAAANTSSTAALHSAASLRESMAEAFANFLQEYSRLLDVSLELRAYRTERTLSDNLRELGTELGFLRASPRDIIEIHSTVLKDKIKGIPAPKAQALLEESRVAVLELMGYLASFYRGFFVSARKGVNR